MSQDVEREEEKREEQIFQEKRQIENNVNFICMKKKKINVLQFNNRSFLSLPVSNLKSHRYINNLVI